MDGSLLRRNFCYSYISSAYYWQINMLRLHNENTASNGDKVLTESLIVKLTLEGKIVNKKARKVWTLFIISQR